MSNSRYRRAHSGFSKLERVVMKHKGFWYGRAPIRPIARPLAERDGTLGQFDLLVGALGRRRADQLFYVCAREGKFADVRGAIAEPWLYA